MHFNDNNSNNNENNYSNNNNNENNYSNDNNNINVFSFDQLGLEICLWRPIKTLPIKVFYFVSLDLTKKHE